MLLQLCTLSMKIPLNCWAVFSDQLSSWLIFKMLYIKLELFTFTAPQLLYMAPPVQYCEIPWGSLHISEALQSWSLWMWWSQWLTKPCSAFYFHLSEVQSSIKLSNYLIFCPAQFQPKTLSGLQIWTCQVMMVVPRQKLAVRTMQVC